MTFIISYLVEQVEVLLSQFEWKSRDSPTETRLTDRYRFIANPIIYAAIFIPNFDLHRACAYLLHASFFGGEVVISRF